MLTVAMINLGAGTVAAGVVAEYRYEVRVNATVIASGVVRHRRTAGWQALVGAVLAQHPAKRRGRPCKAKAVPA